MRLRQIQGFAVILLVCAVPLGVQAQESSADDERQEGESTAEAGSPPEKVPDQPPGTVPDAALRAMVGSGVVLDLVDGQSLAGRLAGFDPQTVTMVVSGTGEVQSIPRSTVMRMRANPNLRPVPDAEKSHRMPTSGEAAPVLSIEPEAATSTPRPEEGGRRQRHFGLGVGLFPSVMAELELGHFYGFANASVLLPAVNSGGSHRYWAFAFGGGFTTPVALNSNWNFDLFALVCPMDASTDADLYVGFGIGAGMHYVWDSGVTFGFKAPLIGGTLMTHSAHSNGGSGVLWYYVTSVVALPSVSLGYRF